MGGKGSSSGTKSSKKKRNKVSSKLLKKKKKTRRKESKVLHSPDSDSVSLSSKSVTSTSSESDYRTRKNKSKKRRRDDSASSYSDDYSMTSASDSLSMHDNKSYKRRKALPQGRKKRPRKKIESANFDIGSSRGKRSRRHHVVKSRNKPLKKKARRHFLSSLSSDSESCSTCDSRSSNSTGDGKHRRSKMILDKKIKSSRGRDSHRARRKRKARSPSGSSCSTCRDHAVGLDLSDEALVHDISVDRIEALVPVGNSRRLKSVISIVNRPTDEEEYRWEKDTQKEEIVCDHEDYPTPKSMDSNEGVDSKDSDDQSHGAFNKRVCVENVESEVILPMKSENIGNEGYNTDDSWSNEVHANSSENEKEIHVSVNFAPLDGDKKDGVGDDLELILRQKALENLRRFKGGLQAAGKSINLDTKNENVNESPIKRNDNIQSKSTEPNSFLAHEKDKRSRPTLPEVKKDSDAEHTATDPPEAPGVLADNDTNPATGEHSSKEQRDEAKNGSDFEQKTMSVMRGGEMVQVSYKVYIPKRAPALARRQLRR